MVLLLWLLWLLLLLFFLQSGCCLSHIPRCGIGLVMCCCVMCTGLLCIQC